MKKRSHKGWTYALMLAALAAALTACNAAGNDNGGGSAAGDPPPAAAEDNAGAEGGGNDAADGDSAGSSGEAPAEQPAEEPTAEDGAGNAAGSVSEDQLAEMPETKHLEVLLEGMPEKVPAKLTKSDQGYAFYLMDGFEYTPEEPGIDMVFHTNWPEYYMRIEKLPPDVNIDDLKSNATEVLKIVGDVVPMEGDQIADAVVRENAKFFYHASNSELSRNITVVQFGGALLRFTLNFPNGEASEGVTPQFYPMIDSFVVIE